MFKYLPLLGFFNTFFSPLGMISYLCVIKSFKIKLGLFDALFLLFIAAILLMNIVSYDIELAFTRFRFYFGFICFYFYFKSGGYFPIKGLLFVLLILVPVEAFLVNTFISPHSMPNYPSDDMLSHFNPGGYQRPYSFGGNSSVSSSILVVLLSMLSFSRVRTYAAIGCVFIFSSGSGFISLILLGVMSKIKKIVFFLFFIIILIVIFHSEIIEFVDSLGIKINSKYVLFLIDFKINQSVEYFHGFTTVNYIFGDLDSLKEGYGGDFGWLFFVLGYGFLSFFIFVSYVLSKATKQNIIPILIALFTTLHYPVIFFLPGQIVLGYLMAMKYRSENL